MSSPKPRDNHLLANKDWKLEVLVAWQIWELGSDPSEITKIKSSLVNRSLGRVWNLSTRLLTRARDKYVPNDKKKP